MVFQNGHVEESITDIRRGEFDYPLLNEIKSKLNPSEGKEKQLPTLLLYDEQGLKLFEDVTYLDEYYLTNSEIEVLTNHADGIAKKIHTGSILVELGSGYA